MNRLGLLIVFCVITSSVLSQKDSLFITLKSFVDSSKYQSAAAYGAVKWNKSASDSASQFYVHSLYMVGSYEKALEVTESVSKTEQSESWIILKADIYDALEDYNSARKTLVDFIDSNPDCCYAYQRLATLYLDYGGGYYNVTDAYITALKYCNDSDAVDVLLQLGNHYYYTESYREARNVFEEVLELAPDNADVMFECGVYFSNVGKYERSNALLQKYKNKRPNDFEADYHLGYNYLAIEDFQKSVEAYTQYILNDSTDLDAWYNRALANAADKQYDFAIRDFKHCLDFDPGFYDAIFNIGHIYQNKGEFAKGIRFFTKCISMNKEDAEAYYNRGVCKYYSDDPYGACLDWTFLEKLCRKDLYKQIRALCED